MDKYDNEHFGKVYYTKRKKYIYPDHINKMELEYKKEKKEFEKDAPFEETKTITFKLNKNV